MFEYLSELYISEVVFHDIPHRRLQPKAILELSDTETLLDTTSQNLLRQKLAEELLRRSFPIVASSPPTSQVPNIIEELLSKPDQGFIGASQRIAQHLYDTQPASSSSGILAVARCQMRTQHGLAIVKLEQGSGARPVHSTDGGQNRLDLEFLERVILTNTTRVLKAGLFILDSASTNSVSGLIADVQISGQQERVAAEYFLVHFLGCQLRDDPAQLTKKYFEAGKRWIDAIPDLHKRFQYEMSMSSELIRDVTTVDLENFAAEHLELCDQQSFLDHMAAEGLSTRSFPKNTERIKNRLRRARLEVANGLQLIADTTISGDSVIIDVTDEGFTQITIKTV